MRRQCTDQFLVGCGERLEQGVHVPVLFAGGDKSFGLPVGHFCQQMVIERKVRAPMYQFQFVGRSFPGFLRVLNQFPAEQEHLVDAFVEKAGDLFAPRFGVGDDCCVMPDDDGFAIQSQRTEEDDGFYPRKEVA